MRLIERFLSVLAPYDCLGCGREGSLLCMWCRPDACSSLPPRCYRCQALSSYSSVCQRCRPRTRLSYVWVHTEYEGIAKQLIRQLKFKRNQGAATVIADLMSSTLPYLDEQIVITHVPTITSHVRQRGYDQAKLIAQALADITDRPRLELLARSGQLQQVGSKRRERIVQLEGAFRPLHKSLIVGTHIVLVDDVLTTGATLEQAALTLKKAGARRIDAIVFAQTR